MKTAARRFPGLRTSLSLLAAWVFAVIPARAAELPAPMANPSATEVAASRADARFWLECMRVHHGYTWEEAATVMGWSPRETEAAATRLGIGAHGSASSVTGADGRVRVLPYPGGRHPRIGFLDGAIDPQRGTKVSLFPPWKDGGYVVLDLPEAIFSNLGLAYLAHTHVATIWTEKGVAIENVDWKREPAGGLSSSWLLPNGIGFGARVEPRSDGANFVLWLTNGTPARLERLRTQVCLMLKGAPGFTAQNQTGKAFGNPWVVAKASNAERYILLAFQRCGRTWGGERCPCIHSDPILPDAEPGARVAVRGALRFHEGPGLDDARRALVASLEP